MVVLYPHNSQIMAKIIMNIKKYCNNLAINWGRIIPNNYHKEDELFTT